MPHDSYDSHDPQQPTPRPISSVSSVSAISSVSDYDDQQFSVECNVRKLLDLPWDQCPWPAVRLRMLRLAIEGAEIYAYRPTHQDAWVIWYPLDRNREARMSPREWAMMQGYAVGQAVGSATGKEEQPC